MGLTAKQKAFIEHYLETLNATQAATLAGYEGNYATLRSIGSENLTKPNIEAEISRRVRNTAMQKDEALMRVALMARGAPMDKLAEVFRGVVLISDEDGENHELIGPSVSDVFQKAHETGVGVYIKSVKQTKHSIHVELYDAQAALFKIMQHLGLLKDPMETEDWRAVAIQDIREGKIQFEPLVKALGDKELAIALFQQAGVTVKISAT